jgi:hypothetical protein
MTNNKINMQKKLLYKIHKRDTKVIQNTMNKSKVVIKPFGSLLILSTKKELKLMKLLKILN